MTVLFGAEDLQNVRMACEKMRDRIRALANEPNGRKVIDVKFGPTVAAKLLGRTPEAIAKAESKGRLPAPPQDNFGRRYYDVNSLIQMRTALGIQPGKDSSEDAVVVAVQNFKGGVGKSTITKHFADYLGLKGLRVLVIDCDPQSSLSTMYDINPATLFDDDNVLSEFLSPRGALVSIMPCIRKSPWPNIDIIPSNLGLQDAEWELTSSIADGAAMVRTSMTTLRHGLQEVIKDYDVILMDPPPAMGFLALNCMAAADGLIVPVPARQLDYLSTIHFFKTVEETLRLLNHAGIPVDYKFVRMVCSMYMTDRPGEGEMWRIMQATYAGRLVSQPIFHSEAIKEASTANRSIYEMNPSKSRRTYDRCRENLDSVFGELEKVLLQQWPSQRKIAGVPLDTEQAAAA